MHASARDLRRPPIVQALGLAAGLSVFFFLVYLATNAITAQRTDVGTAYFAWELRIPLIAAMVVPYMSIDLFFFFAPLLCGTRGELAAHAKRVALAITVAGVCFLVFPLTAGFGRLRVDGAFGPVFEFLRGFDRPYNLAPSLHIALWVLLWRVYFRHTPSPLRPVLAAWFILIAVSTAFTHQHHLIDLATGWLLGMMCLHVYPDAEAPPAGDARLALRYAAGALAVLGIAYLLRPWGVVLLWGVFALATIAAGYAGTGAAIFAKKDGRIPWPTRALLLPYYAGAWLCFLWFKRRVPRWVEAAPGLLVGRKLSGREARRLIAAGVTSVLDLTAEFSETPRLRELAYLNIPVLDFTAPSARQLDEAVRFIEARLPYGKVYVHCALGCCRGPAVAAAYLLRADVACAAPTSPTSSRRPSCPTR